MADTFGLTAKSANDLPLSPFTFCLFSYFSNYFISSAIQAISVSVVSLFNSCKPVRKCKAPANPEAPSRTCVVLVSSLSPPFDAHSYSPAMKWWKGI